VLYLGMRFQKGRQVRGQGSTITAPGGPKLHEDWALRLLQFCTSRLSVHQGGPLPGLASLLPFLQL
jgi:hypothetical protein